MINIHAFQWTIIDDSFEHEIVNDSDKPRLILIVDFHHPDINKENNKSEFNWSKQDMVESGLARNEYITYKLASICFHNVYCVNTRPMSLCL